MKSLFLIVVLLALGLILHSQTPAKVNYNDYQKLVKQVKKHRTKRLLSTDEFVTLTAKPHVVLLDARPKERYNARHVKGAVHLNFSDFTQENLARVIPSPNTIVLIYCNNNFDGDPINLATKSVIPGKIPDIKARPITLALNIPTYINLYGYGYHNVYELKDFISIHDRRIQFAGTDVAQRSPVKY